MSKNDGTMWSERKRHPLQDVWDALNAGREDNQESWKNAFEILRKQRLKKMVAEIEQERAIKTHK